MTKPEQSNPSPLERDLAELARPTRRDGSFRRELRADLAARVGHGERPRGARRRLVARRRPATFVAAALAIAAAVAIVLVGVRGTSTPEDASAAVVTHTAQALTPPPNRILHVKLVSEVHGGVMEGGGYQESWQLTSGSHAGRFIGTFAGGPEHANDGKTESMYDGKKILTRPNPAPLELGDPLALVRENLDNGKARMIGETTIEGASVYKISLPDGYIGYFDTKTYRPLFLDSPTSGPSAASGKLIRMRVVAMEYLRPTPANLQLLSLTAQHPGARVVKDPGAWQGK
jgi:hypothetical protein